jgi:hypothetical protein
VILPLRNELNHFTMRTTHLLSTLAIPLLVAAQHIPPERHLRSPFTPPHSKASIASRTGDLPLWHEDFENGLGGWTVSASEGALQWQLTNEGNTAGFTPGPLESSTGYPTGSWIVADSDAQGTDGISENSTITSGPILGMDTVPYMLLRFEQSFRQLNDDQTLVEVSGNGGADWTIFPVNTSIGGNQSTPGSPASQLITLNISSALVNGSSDIRIRFRWISTQGFTYSWQVDDVALIAARTNDLTLTNALHAVWNANDPHYLQLPCTIYLAGEERTLHFQGTITNNGSTTQSDVRLQVEITSPGQNGPILFSDPTTLAPGASQEMNITGYVLPQDIGNYVFHLRAVQLEVEEAPEDNEKDIAVRVDANVYARDEGIVQSQRDNGGSEYELGNRFWMEEYGRVLHGVDVALGPGTVVGATISATVYDQYMNWIAESDFHTVTADEINALGGDHFITLPLLDPVLLHGQAVFLACVHAYVGAEATWTGLSGSSPAQTSLIHRLDVDQWYYVAATPMVRRNFGADVGLSERIADTPVLSASPAVFDDRTTITYNGTIAPRARWELRDISGRIAQQHNLGNAQGSVILDGSALADGAYLFTLYTEHGSATLRLVHQAQR